MSSDTIYLQDWMWDHLDEMCEDFQAIENRSQAIQYLVRNDKQRTHSP